MPWISESQNEFYKVVLELYHGNLEAKNKNIFTFQNNLSSHSIHKTVGSKREKYQIYLDPNLSSKFLSVRGNMIVSL